MNDMDRPMDQDIEGTIINIKNKYVISDNFRRIEHTPLYHKLLPNDVVEYRVQNDKIHITKINKRDDQVLFGIVHSMDDIHATLTFPSLPSFFSQQIPRQPIFAIGTAILVKISIDTMDVLYIYDTIENRKNDKDLFVNLYREQAKLSSVVIDYDKTAQPPLYTDEYKDLTHLDTFSVDPTGSKDMDDAISVCDNRIYVHIVDIHEQLEPRSENDIHSCRHAFTLYTPEQIENILPKDLAENRCSLVQGENRKTITVEYTIDTSSQSILSHKIYKSIINNKRRYDYDEFNREYKKYPVIVNFYEHWKRRSLHIPRCKLHIDLSTGALVDYELEDYFDTAHKIIETLMILTNITISQLSGSLVPQRYHSKVKGDFEVQTFTGNEMIDSILSIKRYKPAIYDPTNRGHFGLGLDTYTHFTSPIRRYFDVVIHRLLAGVLYVDIEHVLDHINRQEVFIEQLVRMYTTVKWLSYFENHTDRVWDGYVISLTKSGANVLLEECMFEVFIFNPSPTTTFDQLIKEYSKVRVRIKKINWTRCIAKACIVDIGPDLTKN